MQQLTVKPGQKVRLADFDPNHDGGIDKKQGEKEAREHVEALGQLSYRLYAENARALLLVLQGMDTSGKDGTIRTVMAGVDPQSCQVVSFKQPSAEELDHDFLWRIHRQTPGRGNIGIFNRSHYEDVLVVRVHELVPKDVWRGRYEMINAFEKLLVDGGTTIVKVWLHISKEEQQERLQARLDDPTKRWKFNAGDLDERKLWDQYQDAAEDLLTLCNTDHAPWHIVPADRKWHRNLVVARLLRETLERMDPQFPKADPALDGLKVE